MKFSLVIPCYNEAKNLPLLVARCAEIFEGGTYEVILVDNGSTDDSPTVLTHLLADKANLRSVRVEKNQGYGFGILSGLQAARGGILGWTHADMQTDPADALRALELFAAEPAKLFVKGVRRGRPLGDVVFTMGMALFETLLLGHPLWDINGQPTLFPRTLFENWQNPPHDFSLDLYAYYQARRKKHRIRRIAVLFGARAHGVSHWNINWRAKVKFIQRTLRYSLLLRRSLRNAPQ